jgi:hypothetical protein
MHMHQGFTDLQTLPQHRGILLWATLLNVNLWLAGKELRMEVTFCNEWGGERVRETGGGIIIILLNFL